MVLQFLSHYGIFLALTISQIVLLRPKNLFISLFSIAILVGAFFYKSLHLNSMFWFQLSSMFAMIVCLISNKKYKYGGIYQIFLISVGFLMLALQETNQDFLFEIISKVFKTTDVNKMMFVADIYYLSALLFIIGFIPYTEWMVYIFASSSSYIKIICYIIPMTFYLLQLQSVSNVISPYSYVVFGSIMSIYSGICLLFDNKLRRIFAHIILFLFGIQIMLISNHKAETMIYIWLSTSIVLLCVSHLFTRYRTLVYTLYRMKYVFFQNNLYSTLSIISFIYLVLSFFTYSVIIQDIHPLATTIIVCLFILFVMKILYVSIKKYDIKTDIKQITATTITYTTNIYRSIILIIALLFAYFILFYTISNHYKTFIYPEKYELMLYLISIIIGVIIARFLVKYNKPPFLSSATYLSCLIRFGKHINVAFRIILIAFQEFFATMYDYFKTILKSSTPNKLAYILYNNQIYFYIFFLIQLIVILIIECFIV